MQNSMHDVIVIGGGIVGASCAYALAEDATVLLIEAEHAFGYHATGRSAALFSEYFGDVTTRQLTKASKPFLLMPPAEVADRSLLSPRGVVALVTAEDARKGLQEAALRDASQSGLNASAISMLEAKGLCPILSSQQHVSAIHRPEAMDIDVDALHQGLLRGLRARGGLALAKSQVVDLCFVKGMWTVGINATGHSEYYHSPIVLNAAGAWGDDIAILARVKPIGLVAKRRTAVLVDLPVDITRSESAAWPMVTDLSGTFYFKPESGRLLISPCDATPTHAADVQPEEIDVATAVARLEEVTNLQVSRVSHKWAGLRTFTQNEKPLLAEAIDAPGFYWAAGLGGAGVQTAPAVGSTMAALMLKKRSPDKQVLYDADAVQRAPLRVA